MPSQTWSPTTLPSSRGIPSSAFTVVRSGVLEASFAIAKFAKRNTKNGHTLGIHTATLPVQKNRSKHIRIEPKSNGRNSQEVLKVT